MAMGTNFYAKHIPTEQEYKEMQYALKKHQFERLQNLLEASRKEYHIGKRSCGWQFLFQAQGNDTGDVPWDNNLESIKAFLSRSDIEIVDEYGKGFTWEEFFEEIKDSLYFDENHIDLEAYAKKTGSVYYSVQEFKSKDGLRFYTAWFA